MVGNQWKFVGEFDASKNCVVLPVNTSAEESLGNFKKALKDLQCTVKHDDIFFEAAHLCSEFITAGLAERAANVRARDRPR
jgi:hypothetical protein